MANTYRKFYIHIVFAVKNRQALLEKSWRHLVFKYISAVINRRGHFSLAVNGVQDHIHIFLDFNGKELIEDLVREIKKSSNAFIRNNNLCASKFEWQSGYGVFSYSYKQKDMIIKYVLNQEEHHKKQTFRQEYINALKSYEVDYNSKYVFDFLE